MAELVLGPMLRTVTRDEATVWVELDAPVEVEILRHRGRTFTVAGHHYAVVRIQGLTPGTTLPYDVRLDGQVVWPPPDGDLPPPTIRTLSGPPYRILFGSCRVSAPERPPWTCDPGEHPEARGHDALLAFARGLMAGEQHRPDLMLWLGDQIYADSPSPRTREFIRARRDTARPPGEDVNDLQEYAHLYQEAWSAPEVRWLQGCIPSAMIFDDHDVIDDWNISGSWVSDMRREPWWDERITSALASYWVYQHLGNLTPAELDADPLLAEVCDADDAADLLLTMARRVDRDPASFRWSFDRWLGDVHLVVVDSRAARTFHPDRDMLDDEEWAWLEARLPEPARHLLVATSLPVILPEGIGEGQAFSEAIANGRWGRWAAARMETIRRHFDLEHWSAFQRAYDRLLGDIHEVVRGPDAPASALLLSGDVHVGYTARLSWTGDAHAPTWQLTASPMRNLIEPAQRRMLRMLDNRVGRVLGRAIARTAGVEQLEPTQEIIDGPLTRNHVAELTLDGDRAQLHVLEVVGEPAEVGRLRTVWERDLTAG